MKLYNPILGGKYIREISLDIDKYKEVSEEEGARLLQEYPFLINLNSPKSKPSYLDRPIKKKEIKKDEKKQTKKEVVKQVIKEITIKEAKPTELELENSEKLDKIINLLNKMADKPKKQTIWHTIKSKILQL